MEGTSIYIKKKLILKINFLHYLLHKIKVELLLYTFIFSGCSFGKLNWRLISFSLPLYFGKRMRRDGGEGEEENTVEISFSSISSSHPRLQITIVDRKRITAGIINKNTDIDIFLLSKLCSDCTKEWTNGWAWKFMSHSVRTDVNHILIMKNVRTQMTRNVTSFSYRFHLTPYTTNNLILMGCLYNLTYLITVW